jgi:hypothetical protein
MSLPQVAAGLPLRSSPGPRLALIFRRPRVAHLVPAKPSLGLPVTRPRAPSVLGVAGSLVGPPPVPRTSGEGTVGSRLAKGASLR